MSNVDVVLKSGWLMKMPPPGVGKAKKNRFFVLYNNRLDYYTDPKSMDCKPKGRISITDVIQIAETNKKGKTTTSQFCVDCTRRRYELVAQSAQDMADWIAKLNLILKPIDATPARNVNADRPMKAKSIATSNPGPAASQQPSRMSSVPGNARHGGAGNANTVGRRPQSAGNSGQPRAASVGDVSRNPAISPHRVGGATQAAPRGSGTAQQPRGAGQAAQGKQSPRGSYAPVRNGNEGQAKSAISRALSQTGAPWLFDAISREKAETLLSPFKNTYNGVYLVRKSARFKGTYVFSLTWDTAVLHFLASKGPGGAFEINKRRTTCTTLFNLVTDLKKSQSRWRMPLSVYVDSATELASKAIPGTARIDYQKKIQIAARHSADEQPAPQRRVAQPNPTAASGAAAAAVCSPAVHAASPTAASSEAAAEDADEEEEAIGTYEAVEVYVAARGSGDKMDLRIGDVLRVYKIECGWAMAMNVQTREEGWVPADFLEPASNGGRVSISTPSGLGRVPVSEFQQPTSDERQAMDITEVTPRPRTATEAGATLAVLEGSKMLASPGLGAVTEDSEEGTDELDHRPTRDADLDETQSAETSAPGRRSRRLPSVTLCDSEHGESETDAAPPRPPALTPRGGEVGGADVPRRPTQSGSLETSQSAVDVAPPTRPPKSASDDTILADAPPTRPPKSASNDTSPADTPPPPRPAKLLPTSGDSETDSAAPLRPTKADSASDNLLTTTAATAPPQRPVKTIATSGDSEVDSVPPPRPQKSIPSETLSPTPATQPPRPAKDVPSAPPTSAEPPPPRPPKDEPPTPQPSAGTPPNVVGITAEPAYDDVGSAFAPQVDASEPPSTVPEGYVMMDMNVMAANRAAVEAARADADADADSGTSELKPVDVSAPGNAAYDAYSSDEDDDEDDLPLAPRRSNGSMVVFESDGAGEGTPSAGPEVVEPARRESSSAKRPGLFNRRTKRKDRKPPRTPPSQRATRHDGVPVREMAGPDRIKLMLMVKDRTITQEEAVQHVETYELGKVDSPFPVLESIYVSEPATAPSTDDMADVDALLDDIDASSADRASRHE